MAVLIASALAACSDFENRETTYATLEEAAADGAIDRGWIPEYFPGSAVQLRERHDLDTNEVWIRFTFAQGDISSILGACREVERLEVGFPRGTRQIPWWPGELQQTGMTPRDRYRLFRCDAAFDYPGGSYDVPAFIAIEAGGTTAWYWRLS